MSLPLNLVSTITSEGYAAATGNLPNANGFRIEITKIQPVVNGVPKGFFPAVGTALGDGQVRVRAVIMSDTEEYNFNELWIYDGISNAIFCKVKRADGGNLDFVSPYKKSAINYNIKFTTLPANTVTIIADNGHWHWLICAGLCFCGWCSGCRVCKSFNKRLRVLTMQNI